MPIEQLKKTKHLSPELNPTSGIALAWKILGGSWKVEILWQLRAGPVRFGILKNRVAKISDRMLSQSLKEMEKAGLIHREIFAEIPPRVMYSLTEEGAEILPLLEQLNNWGMQRIEQKAKHVIDPGISTNNDIEWS